VCNFIWLAVFCLRRGLDASTDGMLRLDIVVITVVVAQDSSDLSRFPVSHGSAERRSSEVESGSAKANARHLMPEKTRYMGKRET